MEHTPDPNTALTPSPKPSRDLSRDIESSMRRGPGEIVRCVRTFGDHYRCNWWGPDLAAASAPGADGRLLWNTVTTHLVRRSRFLYATDRSGRLEIRDARGRGPTPTASEVALLAANDAVRDRLDTRGTDASDAIWDEEWR